MTCRMDDCHKPIRVQSRRLCTMHYERWRRHGDPTVVKQPVRGPHTCTVEGCDNRHDRRGLCSGHAYRLTRHGTVLAEVPLGDPVELCRNVECLRYAEVARLCVRHARLMGVLCRTCGGDSGPMCDDCRCEDCGGLADCSGAAVTCRPCFYRRTADADRRQQRGIAYQSEVAA